MIQVFGSFVCILFVVVKTLYNLRNRLTLPLCRRGRRHVCRTLRRTESTEKDMECNWLYNVRIICYKSPA